MTLYCALIQGESGPSCCGFKEVYGYRCAPVADKDDNRVVGDKYMGGAYVRTSSYVGYGSTRTEAVRQCLVQWLEYQREYLTRFGVRENEQAMRTFNILYLNIDSNGMHKSGHKGECFSPELRDEVMKLSCPKQVIEYVNYNTGRVIETIVLLVDADTQMGV